MVDQAEIHRKAMSSEVKERREAAELFRDNFADLPDKTHAWRDLHRLTQDKKSGVRLRAANALGSIFPQVTDKKEAWQDLHRLTWDNKSGVRWGAAGALVTAFPHILDKKQAWNDLIRLAHDKKSGVRRRAANALGSVFPQITDKKEAWQDLHRLTQDKDWDVRRDAAGALGSAFSHIPDKKQAWNDLIRLTRDKNWDVRRRAMNALVTAFPHILDKEQAWNDLIRLTRDKNWDVRRDAANALGSAFPHIPDKKQAWNDLIRLTQDEDCYVRLYANHSLGRASISNANETKNEEDFRKELKNSLKFFERSSKESPNFGPSSFCLPFYRSFYTITFEKAGAEDEVQNYLAKAKWALGGSKNKETLLEAVENLANALSEAQKARETDFDSMKSDLNACRLYLDRAADLIGDAEEGAPGAARVLRLGLPIIDERIKEIIREIQEKAVAVCKQTQETPLEELGLATAKSAHKLPIRDPLALTMALGSMTSIARDWCEYLPTDKKVDACEQLKNLAEMEIPEQSAALARVFEYVQENIHIPKIQTVHILETEQEIVRIAVAQFCFELTESFPFTIKDKGEVKTKIFSTLDIAKQDGANIVCLPELCLCEEWISEIKGKYPDMIIIGGSFYKDNKNICPIIMESDTDIPCQPKITPSPFEHGIMGPRMMPGDRIYKYETRFGRFVILICIDFDDLAHFFRETDIDMIFCPSFNSANERFQNEAHSHVERTPSYILIANTGLYGGTSIFGQLNKNYFGELADCGCEERGDSTYKLCEVKKGQEEVIIADFNLDHKYVQVPTPSNPNNVIISVENIKKIPVQPNQSRIKS